MRIYSKDFVQPVKSKLVQIQGLVVGQLGDIESTFPSQAGGPIAVNVFVEQTYGLRHSFIGWYPQVLSVSRSSGLSDLP